MARETERPLSRPDGAVVPVQTTIEGVGLKICMKKDSEGKYILGSNIDDDPKVREEISKKAAERPGLRQLARDIFTGKKYGFFKPAITGGAAILTITTAAYWEGHERHWKDVEDLKHFFKHLFEHEEPQEK